MTLADENLCSGVHLVMQHNILLFRWWLDPLLLLPYHCQWNGNTYGKW